MTLPRGTPQKTATPNTVSDRHGTAELSLQSNQNASLNGTARYIESDTAEGNVCCAALSTPNARPTCPTRCPGQVCSDEPQTLALVHTLPFFYLFVTFHPRAHKNLTFSLPFIHLLCYLLFFLFSTLFLPFFYFFFHLFSGSLRLQGQIRGPTFCLPFFYLFSTFFFTFFFTFFLPFFYLFSTFFLPFFYLFSTFFLPFSAFLTNLPLFYLFSTFFPPFFHLFSTFFPPFVHFVYLILQPTHCPDHELPTEKKGEKKVIYKKKKCPKKVEKRFLKKKVAPEQAPNSSSFFFPGSPPPGGGPGAGRAVAARVAESLQFLASLSACPVTLQETQSLESGICTRGFYGFYGFYRDLERPRTFCKACHAWTCRAFV